MSNPYRVYPDQIPAIWGEIRPLILRGLQDSDGNFAERDILTALLIDHMALWRNEKAVLVAQVATFPRRRVCHLLILAGDDMSEWLQFLAVIEAWAREMKCDAIEELGRKGWVKALEGHGWEQAKYHMRKKL